MKKHILRSTVFNVCFFSITLFFSIAYLPLLLLPRQWYIDAVHFWLHVVKFLEKYVMGITYEIRGQGNLPKNTPYLIAAKHQSAYETFKLHLLFDDPAIILKKELLWIPLWGLHLAKADVIAIDRGTPEKALKSVEDGAQRVAAQGRVIVIFPQGTRVAPGTSAQEKPYKPGIARVQEVTALPIVPMVLNSGSFWPRNSFLKRPGKVVIEFLTPIQTGKMKRKDLMETLEKRMEEKSDALTQEALDSTLPSNNKAGLIIATVALLLFAGYTALWFTAANQVQNAYAGFMQDINKEERDYATPKITGFPGKLKIHIAKEYLQNNEGFLRVENLRAQSWPLPGSTIEISADTFELETFKWPEKLTFTDFKAEITMDGDIMDIHSGSLRKDDFELGIAGNIDFDQEPFPKFDVELALIHYSGFIAELSKKGFINTRTALFTSAGLSALSDDDGIVRVPLRQRNRTLYAGPLPVASLPAVRPPARRSLLVPDR